MTCFRIKWKPQEELLAFADGGLCQHHTILAQIVGMMQSHLHILHQWGAIAGDTHQIQREDAGVAETSHGRQGPSGSNAPVSVHQPGQQRLPHHRAAPGAVLNAPVEFWEVVQR